MQERAPSANLVIFDNASTDGNDGVCRSAADGDDRVRHVSGTSATPAVGHCYHALGGEMSRSVMTTFSVHKNG